MYLVIISGDWMHKDKGRNDEQYHFMVKYNAPNVQKGRENRKKARSARSS